MPSQYLLRSVLVLYADNIKRYNTIVNPLIKIEQTSIIHSM